MTELTGPEGEYVDTLTVGTDPPKAAPARKERTTGGRLILGKEFADPPTIRRMADAYPDPA